MKKAKYAIIAFACVAAICVGFYFFAESHTSNEKELTDVEKIILKDLEKDYPKTARAVVSLYNRIIMGYHNEDTTDEQVEKLADQMLCLLDEDLLLVNPRDEYQASVRAEIKQYKEKEKVILEATVADSKDSITITDKKEGTTESDKLTYINTTYFIRTGKEFTNTTMQFVLRQDDDGRWKVIASYQIEGESSDYE